MLYEVITNKVQMNELNTSDGFWCRLGDNLYHTMLVQSDMLVIHEIRRKISRIIWPRILKKASPKQN